MEMEIKILLWNARGWKNKKEEIIKRIQDYDVCVITEIKNKIKEDFKIPGFIIIIKNSQRIGMVAAGGIVIIIRKGIRVKEITNIRSTNVNIEVVGIQVVGLSKELTIVAFYRRPGEAESAEKEWLREEVGRKY